MADGVIVHNGAVGNGTAFDAATDDAGAAGHVQLVKLAAPTDGSAAFWGDATDGLPVEVTNGTLSVTGSFTLSSDLLRIQVTPTISTSIYAAKDAIGGLMTFANAAASSGGSGMVRGVTIVDKDQERADIDLVLFRASITAPTDNSPFDPTDTELLDFVGFVPMGSGFYSDFSDNAAAYVAAEVPYDLSGTDLYGVMVARSTPTYTGTSDLVVTLHVERF